MVVVDEELFHGKYNMGKNRQKPTLNSPKTVNHIT